VTYIVKKTREAAQLDLNWQNRVWLTAETLEIKNFRPESSSHRPQTFVRLLHDEKNIYGIFHVRDQYVRSVRTNFGDEVWKDSCVEFFIQPKPDKGHFNFEFNCGGALLSCYITDPTRTTTGFKKFEKLPSELGNKIKTRSTLPLQTVPEIIKPVQWSLQFSIPIAVLENFVGPLGDASGQTWRGNFFKCAEEVSHPHWASWSPVDEFNFHLPRCFGAIRFE
jgi:hypothetical protein